METILFITAFAYLALGAYMNIAPRLREYKNKKRAQEEAERSRQLDRETKELLDRYKARENYNKVIKETVSKMSDAEKESYKLIELKMQLNALDAQRVWGSSNWSTKSENIYLKIVNELNYGKLFAVGPKFTDTQQELAKQLSGPYLPTYEK